ncbi:unnamed protein product [Phytomonas sp. Hart1]|nr:unnamed protein product [Phytomonas sp. Hart1]|eukprot:CCW70378.1 unnamed protein product [Phytomonas sp. isolate Hart1]
MANISAQKNARFGDIPSLDKEMLSMQNTIFGNSDKLFSMQGSFNTQEDAMKPLPSPESGGVLTAETSPTFHAFVHPTNRLLVMAVAKMEQNYVQTRLTLQKCSRNVLLGVLLSMVDEDPTTFVEPIRLRLEHLLANRAGGGGGGGGGGGMPTSNVSGRSAGSLNGSTTIWSTPQTLSGGGGGNSSPSTIFAAPSPTHRKSRGHRNKEDDQELCSVHHCLRVMKHLQLNHATGLYECVHGFHCLVDGPLESTASNPTSTANVNENANSNPNANPAPTSNTREGEPQAYHTYSSPTSKEIGVEGGSGEHHFGCTPLIKHFPSTVGAGSQILMDDQTGGVYSMEEDPALDVHTLTNLLKSVRALEKDE